MWTKTGWGLMADRAPLKSMRVKLKAPVTATETFIQPRVVGGNPTAPVGRSSSRLSSEVANPVLGGRQT